MATRISPFMSGNWYHIYNRGTDKRTIFNQDSDYDRFLKSIYLANSKTPIRFRDSVIYQGIDAWKIDIEQTLIDIVAWVLMPNHFHFLVFIPDTSDGKDLSSFMLKLSTAYSMYFNKKYKRNGSLFQGTFKSKLIDNEDYLRYLIAYIHLNPVKLIQSDWKEVGVQNTKQVQDYLASYQYSSFIDLATPMERKCGILINEKRFPSGIADRDTLKHEIFHWIQSSKG